MRNEKAEEIIRRHLEEMKETLTTGWSSENSDFLKACAALYQTTGEEVYKNIVLEHLDTCIKEDGSIEGYVPEEYKLASISGGTVLFFAYDKTGEEKYRAAIEGLMNQLRSQPRFQGVFCYDGSTLSGLRAAGLYEAQVFYMMYETRFGGKEHYNDVVLQFKLMRAQLFDEEKKLYHTELTDGKAQGFNLHAEGAVLKALIDTLSVMDQPVYEYYNDLKVMFKEALKGVLQYQKKDNLYFYENLLDSSEGCSDGCVKGTAAVLYAMAKGCRLKAVLAEKYEENAARTFDSLTKGVEEKMADCVKPGAMAAYMLAYAQVAEI